MALTRKLLKSMGIDDEKIDQIIEAHTEVTDGLKAEKEKLKEAADKADELSKELEKANEIIKAGSKDDAYKVKYDALKTEFDAYKADVTAKETKQVKASAYERLLKDAGISEKRIAAVLKVSDVDSIEFDENGKIKDAEKLTESIKSEWADFIATDGTQGANTPNPPAQDKSKIDLGSLSMEEYIKARTNS